MAYVESAVVVYLRELYYPAGFEFPLVDLPSFILRVEIAREAATIVMLLSVAYLTGQSRWSRFGYFLVTFGVWDFFYYVWLKVLLNWPASLFDSDILFLIPVVWIGPVVAPVLVALMMVIVGILITRRIEQGRGFRVPLSSWLCAGLASAVILYSFMSDTEARLGLAEPTAYNYALLLAGLLLYIVAYVLADRYSDRH